MVEGLSYWVDLVILRRVGIEIVLAIELGVLGHSAVEEEASQGSEAQSLVVGHRQDAGHAEADGARRGCWWRAKFIGTAAPHLGFGL